MGKKDPYYDQNLITILKLFERILINKENLKR